MADEPKKLRGLGYAAARSCEEAREEVCKCRCGGALHGAKRGGHLFNLPENDPHHIPLRRVPAEERPACERCGQPIGDAGFVPSREVTGRDVCELCRTDENRLQSFDWFKSTRPVLPSWPGTLHQGRIV